MEDAELIGEGELRYVMVVETIWYKVPIIYNETMSDVDVANTATDAIANADDADSVKWVVAHKHTAELLKG